MEGVQVLQVCYRQQRAVLSIAVCTLFTCHQRRRRGFMGINFSAIFINVEDVGLSESISDHHLYLDCRFRNI